MDRRFGRLVVPDERDRGFRMAALIPAAKRRAIIRNWWDDGWWGDQGETSQCVAYAWDHWLCDGPIRQPAGPNGYRYMTAEALYFAAQKVDEVPGENYEGTSVRAGAKVLASRCLIKSYYWAWDAGTVAQTIKYIGPVVVGTDWYEGMMTPNARGVIRARGQIVGGHAYVLNGVNTLTSLFRVKNSWGRAWGKDGHAYIPFADMQGLLAADGEACLAMELLRTGP